MGMYQYARNLELLYETPAELPIDVAPPKHNLQAMLRRVAASGRTVLTEEESKRFVTTYGFPVIAQIIADDVDEALAAAAKIGYPVVLKIVSHDITHKSAAGGVEVGVCSPADLETAYARMMKRVKKSSPKAVIEGVSVQKMVREVDYELILGMKKDQQFGSVIVFGAGGVDAEGLADFSVSSAAAEPDPRAPHDGGDAHLQDHRSSRGEASLRPTSASWRNCSRCCPTSWSTSPRSPRSTSTRS